MLTKDRVLTAFTPHTGADRGVRGCDLVREICAGETTPAMERQLRHVIEDLRREGHHICGTPAQGYFIAATPAELDASCKFLYDRAMSSLTQVAAMRRVSLPDLAGQLRLPT